MSKKLATLTKPQIFLILGAIWLGSNACDRLWLALDNFPPGWDQSNHLTNSLRYLEALQTPEFFNGEWWRHFWMLSPKYPPLTYILSALCQQVSGRGNSQALLINFLFSAILLLSVYSIGKVLFSPKIGLWAAGITVLLPRLYQVRLHYLLDTPTTVMAVASFACLTLWRSQKTRRGTWIWTVIFGICWGLALLVKQSVMFFLTVPLLWLAISYLWRRKWERVVQLIASFLISLLLWGWWYRTNWFYLFSTVQNSNAIPAAYEGDPPLNTLAAWTYYWKDLPGAISWGLLLVPLVGWLLHLLGRFPSAGENATDRFTETRYKRESPRQNPAATVGTESKSKIQNSIGWLALYVAGGYLICSAITNKDPRYIMPYLPVLAVFLAYCLVQWRGRWQGMRWLAVGLSLLVLLGKLFPVPAVEDFAAATSPGWLSHPYLEKSYPNAEVIDTILQAAPYQKTTLGVIPSIEPINHNTLNYYGALREFQVAGRELASKPEAVAQDGRSLDWFLVQPECHGSKVECNGLARDSQIAFGESLADNPAFRAERAWELPSENRLQLYRRRRPSVEVKPLTQGQEQVQLNRVTLPQRVPAGLPVPVTYEWSGAWEQLASGLVLLTWKSAENPDNFWLHDHGIARGELQAQTPPVGEFQVIESTAMLPGAELPAGKYNLTATYLNRKTGETYPIPTPNVAITIDPSAAAISAPELDWVTQLRDLALNLKKGIPGLEPIFQQIDRLNQYDSDHDYLRQAEITLTYRLAQNSGAREINWRYGLLLSQVLQEDPQGAIATLKQLVKLDYQNPYTHAYLAFVYLYNWQPKAAEIALEPALKSNPEMREIQALKGISYLMQGNLLQGWRAISPILGN